VTREGALLVLVGTKAQFIKTAPILNELDRRGLGYQLVYTGQHSETFSDLEAAFGTRSADDVLVPDFEADSGRSFLAWSLRFWTAAGKRLSARRWRNARMALVHGDTASTLFGAMASRIAGVPVAHIEAGLRSSRLMEPFPEELIRRGVSKVARWHFAPDQLAVSNLSAAKGQVINTNGNTLRDALRLALAKNGGLAAQGGGDDYGVVSLHRNENLSNVETFDSIMGSILAASSLLPLRFVLHPVTRKRIESSRWKGLLAENPRITLMARASYPDFVKLLLGAHLLMTDGGSNQEEAAMLGIPTLLLRRATERQDGLDDCVELSGLQPQAIEKFVHRYRNAKWTPRFSDAGSPSSIIVDAMQRHGVWQGVVDK
jgi:UDP-N-acetylglucosamine 2-epimerase (non-hydrolysing)